MLNKIHKFHFNKECNLKKKKEKTEKKIYCLKMNVVLQKCYFV